MICSLLITPGLYSPAKISRLCGNPSPHQISLTFNFHIIVSFPLISISLPLSTHPAQLQKIAEKYQHGELLNPSQHRDIGELGAIPYPGLKRAHFHNHTKPPSEVDSAHGQVTFLMLHSQKTQRWAGGRGEGYLSVMDRVYEPHPPGTAEQFRKERFS